MNRITRSLALVAVVAPLGAWAQTTPVQPADQPRTQLEKEQTQKNGQATKYGTTNDQTDDSATTPKAHKRAHATSPTSTDAPTKTTPQKTGDIPTYPAPAKDGSPTK